jgi:hypothetical protein
MINVSKTNITCRNQVLILTSWLLVKQYDPPPTPFPYFGGILDGSSHILSRLVHPKWINPTYPTNLLRIRGMSHQVYHQIMVAGGLVGPGAFSMAAIFGQTPLFGHISSRWFLRQIQTCPYSQTG